MTITGILLFHLAQCQLSQQSVCKVAVGCIALRPKLNHAVKQFVNITVLLTRRISTAVDTGKCGKDYAT